MAEECWEMARAWYLLHPPPSLRSPTMASCHHLRAPSRYHHRPLVRRRPARMRTSPRKFRLAMPLPRQRRRRAHGWSAQYATKRWYGSMYTAQWQVLTGADDAVAAQQVGTPTSTARPFHLQSRSDLNVDTSTTTTPTWKQSSKTKPRLGSSSRWSKPRSSSPYRL